MCFGGNDNTNQNVNPAPYSTADSYKQVTETATPVNPASPALSAQAAAADAADKPTPPVTGYSTQTFPVATSGIATM